MRCTPAPEPAPVPVVPFTGGRAAARAALARRLADEHGLTPDAALAAVHAVETGRPTEHQQLVAATAHALGAELAQRIGQIFETFARALQPAAGAAAAALRQLDDALRAAGHAASSGKPGHRRNRPAWQSPYGPARKRRGE